MDHSDITEIFARFDHEMPWRTSGLCRKAKSRSAWFIADEDSRQEWQGERVSGRRAQLLAVDKYCSECDVQWDCAMWAWKNEEPQGVWGMTIRDMLWLQRFGSGDIVIEAARMKGEPVQITVRGVRRCVNRAELEAEELAS